MRVAPAAALLLALVAGACQGANPSGCSSCEKAPQPDKRGALPGNVTPEFQAMRSVLAKAAVFAAGNDEAELRLLSHEIVQTGIGLLRGTMPHDLGRADVPRFLEGRVTFGDALKEYAARSTAGSVPELYAALARLNDAFWGWVDAYKGLAPEKAV